MRLALLALAGCNGILGIPHAHEGVLLDGGAHPDAHLIDAVMGVQDSGCAGIPAQRTPLDLLVLLGSDSSMTMTDGGGATRLERVKAALDSFFTGAPTSVSVGLTLFPVGSPDSCAQTDYVTPTVEIGVLPGNGTPLDVALAATTPNGATPTSAALDGALMHATQWSQARPGHTTAVILTTDHEPDECDQTVSDIADLAAAAASSANPIPTFVIGIGDVADLDQVAASGGTSQSFLIDPTANLSAQVAAALDEIQRSPALACRFSVPSGGPSSSIAVTLTSGGSTTTLVHNGDRSSCGTGGWYFDDNTNPNEIVLCGGTCDAVQTDSNAQIQVVFPCI